MRFIFTSVLLITSVSASTLVERPEHNTHKHRRADFEDVIGYYSKNINNEYEMYKFIKLISTGKGNVNDHSFNGVGSLRTYEDHKSAFELLQDIGNKYGSGFYIPYGPNYEFVRTAINYGALNKGVEENKGLIQKSSRKVEAVNKLSKVLGEKIDSENALSIKNTYEVLKIISAEKESENKKARILQIRSQRQALEKQEYKSILKDGDEKISNSNLKQIWKLCKDLLNMNQNEELCLFNEEGSSIDSVPKDLLGRLFTLIIEPNDSNDEKYRLRRLFNKDLIKTTFDYNINIVDSTQFSEKEKDLLKSICLSLVKKHGLPEIYTYIDHGYSFSLCSALRKCGSNCSNQESAEELFKWSLCEYKTESGLNYYQDLHLALVLSEKFDFSYEDIIKLFTLIKDCGLGILSNYNVDPANEKYLNKTVILGSYEFSTIYKEFIKEFLTKFADGSENSIILLQEVLRKSTFYPNRAKILIDYGKDNLKKIFIKLNDYSDDRVIEVLKKILDLGIIDADSVRQKFKEIKESNRYIHADFIKSLLRSKTGESFNFSNDEIIEIYRLEDQNNRPNIAHIVAAAEDIMRNQRPYLRRYVNNINNINVGNNWGATETIMNAVSAIDEIKIFYSGEKYKETAGEIIYDELKKFSSPVKSLNDLIEEFGCYDFSKGLNDFDAKLNEIKKTKYSVDNRIEILRKIDALKNNLDKAIRDYAKQNIKKITKYKEPYEKFNKDETKKSKKEIDELICNEFYKNFYTDYFGKIINGILIETQLKRGENILPIIVDIIENTDEVIVVTDIKGEKEEIPLKEDYENFFNGMVDAAIANNKEGNIGDTCQFDRFVQSALKTYVPFIELFNLGADVELDDSEFEVWKKMQGMCKDFAKIIDDKYTFKEIADASGFNQLLVTHNKNLLKELTERYISFVKSNATNEILEKLKIANGEDDKFFESIEKEMNILTYAMSETKEIDDSIDAVLRKVEPYVPSKLINLVKNDEKKLYIREFIKRIFEVFSVNYENLSYAKSMNEKIEEMFEKMGLNEIEFEEKRSNDKLVENTYNDLNGKNKTLDQIVNEIHELFIEYCSQVTKEEIEKIVKDIKSKEGKA